MLGKRSLTIISSSSVLTKAIFKNLFLYKVRCKNNTYFKIVMTASDVGADDFIRLKSD